MLTAGLDRMASNGAALWWCVGFVLEKCMLLKDVVLFSAYEIHWLGVRLLTFQDGKVLFCFSIFLNCGFLTASAKSWQECFFSPGSLN